MLKRENGGGNEDSHLLSSKHRLVRRAECDLGLSESNVSAKESVHRIRLHHILFYILNSVKLRIGLVIAKRRLKVTLKIVVLGESKALSARTLGVKLDKLLCYVLNDSLGLCLGPSPLARAEFRKLYKSVVRMSADIL